MAWLKGFAGRAENLLNQLDQGAGTVLNNSNQRSKNSFVGETAGTGTECWSAEAAIAETRVNIVEEKSGLIAGMKQGGRPASQTKNKKDKQVEEEHLIKFLNGGVDTGPPDMAEHGLEWGKESITQQDSSRSCSPGCPTEMSGSIVMESDCSEPWGDSSCNSGRDSSASLEAVQPEGLQEETPLSYQHTTEPLCDNAAAAAGVTWELDLATQNQMLRQEISSLTEETSRVLARAKQAEKEAQNLRSNIEIESRNTRKQAETIRKMEDKRERVEKTFHQEMEKLRKLIKERDQENLALQGQLSAMLAENQQHLSQSEAVAGAQSQAIMAMEERMRRGEELAREREAMVEDQRQAHRNLESNLTEKIKGLEVERQNTKQELLSIQQNQEDLKKTRGELQQALSSSKVECTNARKELLEYRTKAQRILQEKESFILQLKAGICKESDEHVQDIELQQITKERNLFCEEATRFSGQLSSARKELGELEQQMLMEQEINKETTAQLSQQLQSEREKREELESDLSSQNEELRYTREDLTRAKTSHLTAIAEKENELKKLRNQISFRQKNGISSGEEDKRIQQLTENLLKKQALVETISSEKKTMIYKIEHLERQLSDSRSLKNRKYGLPYLESSVEERGPAFLQESPFDGAAARRVKQAYTEIDKLSIRVGIALRRFPIARIFVLFYMVMLHFWVFLVLFSYTPDTDRTITTIP